MRSLAGALLLHTPPVRAAAVLLLTFGAVGCGAGHPTPAAAPTPPTTSTSSATTPPPAPPAAAAEAAPCSGSVFLPVLKEAIDDEAQKLRIVKAQVKRCVNGYAQVFAVPDESVCEPGVGYCYEHEQVFLEWTDSRWRILTAGTGISCEPPGFETIDLIVKVCRALGYPQS